MAASREAIAGVGAFDLRLGPGAAGNYDDTLFGWAMRRAGLNVVYLPNVAVEHNFDADRLNLPAFMSAARRMAVSRAIVDRELDPSLARPSVLDLAAQAPGLAFRCLTQVVRYVARPEPDQSFLVRYYRLKLWQALRARV
jgi:GT2 family glycosyltransferase